jgi:HEAT repeat protein
MPYATNRDIQQIQDWWKKNRTKEVEELKRDRIKDLLAQIKTKGKYIELYRIADAFGYVQDKESVAAIRSLLLKHEDPLLRQKLLIALGKQQAADVVLIVVPYLKSKDDGVAVSAITALGFSGDEKAKEHLMPLVS